MLAYWWYGLVALPLGVVWLTSTLRRPTFAYEPIGATFLRRGMLYSEFAVRVPSGQGEIYSPRAVPILDVFIHHGDPVNAVWCALTSGEVYRHTKTDQVRIAYKEDVYRKWRPERTADIDVPEPPPDVLSYLTILWNYDVGRQTMETIPDGWGDIHADAVRRKLVIQQERRGVVDLIELSLAGRTLLAAECRRNGEEILQGAQESDGMTYQDNRNIDLVGSSYIEKSTGSTACGSVTGDGAVSQALDPGVVDALRQLIEAIATRAAEFLPAARDNLEQSIEVIEGELQQDRPDDARLARATRNALRVGDSLLLGVIGNGIWAVLANWSGLS
jgi:hypothetical protein